MSRTRRTIAALAAAAIVLVIAAWFDNTGTRDALQQANAGDVSALGTMTALGSLLVAGSVLLLGVLAWRSASVAVGLAFVVVGGFFTAQMWLWWNLASSRSDVLPEALAVALRNLFYNTQSAGLNAVATIGAGMLVAGIAGLARWWRGRAVAGSRVDVVVPTPRPVPS